MCLAIPVRVIEVRGGGDDPSCPQVAVVDASGIRREVRLDCLDRPPAAGEYVIVHAGFAIHTMAAAEAEINLELLRALAEGLPTPQRGAA